MWDLIYIGPWQHIVRQKKKKNTMVSLSGKPHGFGPLGFHKMIIAYKHLLSKL